MSSKQWNDIIEFCSQKNVVLQVKDNGKICNGNSPSGKTNYFIINGNPDTDFMVDDNRTIVIIDTYYAQSSLPGAALTKRLYNYCEKHVGDDAVAIPKSEAEDYNIFLEWDHVVYTFPKDKYSALKIMSDVTKIPSSRYKENMKNKLREGTLVAMGGGERLHQFNFNKNQSKTTDGIPQWVRDIFVEASEQNEKTVNGRKNDKHMDWVKKAFREAAEEKPRLKESAYYEDESFNDMVTYEFQKVIDNYDLEVIEAEPEFDYVNVCIKDKSSGMEFWLGVHMIEPTTGQVEWNQYIFDLKSSEDLIRQKLQNDEEFMSSAFIIAEEAAEEAYEQNEKTANGREFSVWSY